MSTGTFAAVDLGASTGRVMVARVGGDDLDLKEAYRFPNRPIEVGGTLHWDILALYAGMIDGLRAATRDLGSLSSIGIDSWAVDYGLLDSDDQLLGNPVHYRDRRTDGVMTRVLHDVPAAQIYATTGIQFLPFNTAFQLVAAAESAQLAAAKQALLIPDLLGFWLTGEKGTELTNASTTQLLDARSRIWATSLMARMGIRTDLFPALREPGAVIGELRPEMATAAGLDRVPLVAVGSHDTASAVVGVPAQQEKFAYISCGTWSLVGVELDKPVLSEESRHANFTNELGVDGTVRYLRNVMGLWLLQESQRTWAQAGLPADLDTLLYDAGRVPAFTAVVDVNDSRFLPPGDMPSRIADACGETGQVPPQTQAETVRCILDSLALAYRAAVNDAQRLSGRSADVIHLIGGGVRNELLCQLTADACGVPVVAGPVEAAALGNLVVQARSRGVLHGSLSDLRAVVAATQQTRRYEPRGDVRPWDAATARLGSTPARA